MPTSLICVDANVVVKLVAAHEDTAVQDMWEKWSAAGCQVIAPALLFYEVTNALYRSMQHGVISAVAARDALQAALSLPIQLHSEPGLHARALAVAQRFGLPATYDAHYVALAEQAGAELLTTDQRLVNRCQQDWIKLVE
jgi:predicted nucleic acid-binding protein